MKLNLLHYCRPGEDVQSGNNIAKLFFFVVTVNKLECMSLGNYFLF